MPTGPCASRRTWRSRDWRTSRRTGNASRRWSAQSGPLRRMPPSPRSPPTCPPWRPPRRSWTGPPGSRWTRCRNPARRPRAWIRWCCRTSGS
ncbi:hypothetical protein ACFFX0_28405 [Citricoccus parietis]|uniref:Uncharacterized protein n=1 Tax=Citricoccus parietis TaxID=592307 RepID=A0ABV5G7G6_9MICC